VESNLEMAKSTLKMLEDLQHIQKLLAVVETQIQSVAKRSHRSAELQRARERILEAEARLDGVEAFVSECQKVAEKHSTPREDEIDVWL
jgi:phage shock protein A